MTFKKMQEACHCWFEHKDDCPLQLAYNQIMNQSNSVKWITRKRTTEDLLLEKLRAEKYDV